MKDRRIEKMKKEFDKLAKMSPELMRVVAKRIEAACKNCEARQ